MLKTLAAKRLTKLETSIGQRAAAYLFAVGGDFSQAIRELDRFLAATAEDPNGWFQTDRAEAVMLRQMLIDDPQRGLRQLKNWEKETREALGLV